MKTITRILLCLLALLCAVQAASAFQVKTMTITPTGDLTPGETVTAHFKIEFTPVSGSTFDDTNRLQFNTDLSDAKWDFTILINDIPQPLPKRGGAFAYLTGYELSYASKNEVAVEGTLEGTAPSVSSTATKNVLKITQQDQNGKDLADAQYNYVQTRKVVNPEDIQSSISVVEKELATLRTSIDDKAKEGVDTTSAESYYTTARNSLNSAKTASASQASTYITNAQNAINNGEAQLDKAWAEKELADAKQVLSDLDSMVTYFTVNRSMSSTDTRLLAITTKGDSALQFYTNAESDFNAKNYNQARIKAVEAETRATEAYNSAVALQKELGEGFSFNLGGSTFIIVGAVAVIIIIAVVGVFVMRKKRWDELG